MIANVSDPMNDSDAVNKRYVDSGLNQDGIVSDTSIIVSLIINTTNGELSFPLAAKLFDDNSVYDELQMILDITNNTGPDLSSDCDLEVAAGMTFFAEFFKASDSITSSSGTGPETLPPIGNYYNFIEASTPNNGVDRYAHFTYAKHQNNT